jgi:hypothetical protein
MRARNLKPGFFKNEELSELPPYARLLFAGLWLLADREGRLEDRPKRIKAELFPYETVQVEKLLDGLAAAGFIHRYGQTQPLIWIPTFKAHQNPHKNEKESELPAPGDITKLPEENGTKTELARLIPSSLIPESLYTSVRTVFEYWQKKLGHPDAKLSDDRKGKIVARLREGITPEHLMRAVDGCAASPYHMGDNTNGRRYDSIELIFRNAGKVDEFAAITKPGDKPPDTQARLKRIANAQHQYRAGNEDAARAMVNEDEWAEVVG